MATTVFDGINSVDRVLRGPPKNIPAKFVQIGPAVWEEKICKEIVATHDEHRTTLKTPLEHIVLR